MGDYFLGQLFVYQVIFDTYNIRENGDLNGLC